ncbi:hypothetical protein K8R62_00720 [bacterium]|nr:hypothetical protein [bacterium]
MKKEEKNKIKSIANLFLAIILRIGIIGIIIATYYLFSYFNLKPFLNGVLTFFIWITLIPVIILEADTVMKIG